MRINRIIAVAIAILGLPVLAAHADEVNSAWSVERVRDETLKAIVASVGEKEAETVDLSYITSDLVKKYRATAKRKASRPRTAPTTQPEGRAVAKTWCYYGHHFIIDTGWVAEWTNASSDDGCDRETDRCYGEHVWIAKLSEYFIMPNCPESTQGHNSVTFAGN